MLSRKFPQLSALLCTLLLLPGCWASEKKDAQEEKTEHKKGKSKKSKKAAHNDVRYVKSADEFDAILQEGNPVILDFYAEWCGPCQGMKPILHDMAKKYGDQINFVALEADNKDLDSIFKKHKVTGFPTFVFLDAQGNVIKKQSGGQSSTSFDKDINNFLQQAGNP